MSYKILIDCTNVDRRAVKIVSIYQLDAMVERRRNVQGGEPIVIREPSQDILQQLNDKRQMYELSFIVA